MGRRVADVPAQPASVDCTPSPRICPVHDWDDGVSEPSQLGFTVLGAGIATGAILRVGSAGMCCQMRRLFHSRALEGVDRASMMGFAIVRSTRRRKPLLKRGLLRLVTAEVRWADKGFALAIVSCVAGAEPFDDPVGPVTEVSVSTTVFPT